MLSFVEEEEAEAGAAGPLLPQQIQQQKQQRRRLLAPGCSGSSAATAAAAEAVAPVFRSRSSKQSSQQQQVAGPIVRPALTHKEFLRRRAAELSAAAEAADSEAPEGPAKGPEPAPRKRQRKTGWDVAEEGEEQEGGEKSTARTPPQTGWGPPIDPKIREERVKAIESAIERDAERRRRGYGQMTDEEEAETALQRMW